MHANGADRKVGSKDGGEKRNGARHILRLVQLTRSSRYDTDRCRDCLREGAWCKQAARVLAVRAIRWPMSGSGAMEKGRRRQSKSRPGASSDRRPGAQQHPPACRAGMGSSSRTSAGATIREHEGGREGRGKESSHQVRSCTVTLSGARSFANRWRRARCESRACARDVRISTISASSTRCSLHARVLILKTTSRSLP